MECLIDTWSVWASATGELPFVSMSTMQLWSIMKIIIEDEL